MTNSSKLSLSTGATSPANEAIIQIALRLAKLHARPVHVGQFINEDTGETKPAFFLSKSSETSDA
jgi:hypothetical protein